jgi:hypothetical protein
MSTESSCRPCERDVQDESCRQIKFHTSARQLQLLLQYHPRNETDVGIGREFACANHSAGLGRHVLELIITHLVRGDGTEQRHQLRVQRQAFEAHLVCDDGVLRLRFY